MTHGVDTGCDAKKGSEQEADGDTVTLDPDRESALEVNPNSSWKTSSFSASSSEVRSLASTFARGAADSALSVTGLGWGIVKFGTGLTNAYVVGVGQAVGGGSYRPGRPANHGRALQQYADPSYKANGPKQDTQNNFELNKSYLDGEGDKAQDVDNNLSNTKYADFHC